MKHISAILLTLPDGRIVFQRRSKDAAKSPGLLGFFGGHVEEGETFDQAMMRELGEETSLDMSTLSWGFVQDFASADKAGDGSNAMFHLYWAEVPDAKFEVYEGDGAEVYTREEALERTDVAVPAKYALENILKKKSEEN